MPSAKLKFYLLVSTMVLIWCGNFIALKICLRAMPPFGVAAFRVCGSALLLLFIYRVWGDLQSWKGLRRHDFSFFLTLAFVGLFLNQTLFVIGLNRTTVAHSAIIVTFGPVFTLLFAWMRGQEKLTRMTLLGMLVSVAGIVFINFEKDFTFQTRYLLGDFFTMAGSIAFAYYTVLSKNASSAYGALKATAWTYFAGACLFLPMGVPAMCRINWAKMGWENYLAFFYIAALSSVLAQLIFYYALRHMSASGMASLTYFQPVITTASSALLLSERLSLNFIIGGCVVLSGIVLARRRG